MNSALGIGFAPDSDNVTKERTRVLALWSPAVSLLNHGQSNGTESFLDLPGINIATPSSYSAAPWCVQNYDARWRQGVSGRADVPNDLRLLTVHQRVVREYEIHCSVTYAKIRSG
jgi:hypothetical protein